MMKNQKLMKSKLSLGELLIKEPEPGFFLSQMGLKTSDSELKHKEQLVLLDLYSKPMNEVFNEYELGLIAKYNPKNKFKALYAWREKSYKNIHIALLYDFEFNSPRKSPVLNSYKVLASRDITDLEYYDFIKNYGSYLRRFLVYEYNSIEDLIISDKEAYDIETPSKFVEFVKTKQNEH